MVASKEGGVDQSSDERGRGEREREGRDKQKSAVILF